MKVLITGASGYLGRAIFEAGVFSQPTTLSRKNCNINCNLEKEVPELATFDMVIHAAGKAHVVPRTEAEKAAFFEVNVTGSSNLLKGLERAGVPNTFVFISTVAVYGVQIGDQILETAPMSATDAYGKSKALAEKLVKDWCYKHEVHCVILRLPLIVGTNPPGNLGAMIKAIRKGYYFNIGGGHARRSAVLLEDVVRLLPSLYGRDGTCNLTDGFDFSFAEMGQHIATQLGCKTPWNIPLWMAAILALTGNLLGSKSPFNQYKLKKMTSNLTFDTKKAIEIFNWKPRKVLSAFSIK